LGMGMTCAACHSQTIRVNGQKVKIDGGASQFDIQGFEMGIVKAMEAVLDPGHADRFTTFVARIGKNTDHKDESHLKAAMEKFLVDFRGWHFQNHRTIDPDTGADIPYGPGRLDGLGGGTNDAVCNLTDGLGDIGLQSLIDNPANCRSSHPPTSIPYLWGMGKQEFVQWNGQVHQNKAIARDVGQATASYGKNWITGDGKYKSTANPRTIYELEKFYDDLKPPRWEDLVAKGVVEGFKTKADKDSLIRGRQIYLNRCNSCHAVVPEQDKWGFWKIYVGELGETKTDTTMFEFNKFRMAFVPEILREPFGLDSDQKEMRAEDYRTKFVGGVTLELIEQDTLSAWVLDKGLKLKRNSPTQAKEGYKARSLEGVIYTAPYLHNGSVATIEELLKPEDERAKTFYVGCMDYDLKVMGYTCDDSNGVLFDTALYGNGNGGHSGPEYGTGLSATDRTALINFLKYLEPSPEGRKVLPATVIDLRLRRKRELKRWEDFLDRIEL
ncbi:MAG: di-heme-cytochrome C peroxidase, partial [Pseudomonadota bacterium]